VNTLRLGFAGTPDFAARHLAALIDSPHQVVGVLTQPDRPAGRGKKDRPSAVKSLALDRGLAVLQPPTLRDPEAVDKIAALKLDALVVVAYGLLLPQTVLDLPRYGCLNVHGSLLPRWRGAAPIQRAIEAGDDESGVTIMLMDAGLDTGPMLAHGPCKITPLTTSGDLYAKLAELGPGLLLEVLADLPAKLRMAEPQDDASATHAAKISKSEAEIDWSLPAATLARRIRAFNPAPGCFAFLGDQRLKIWAATPMPARGAELPGVITAADAQAICVRCGEGALLLERLQLPGSRAMDSADILRGHGDTFSPGTRFSAPQGR
jgi:methionyl-tRNA formyltransferase